jgi:hypothetical protein
VRALCPECNKGEIQFNRSTSNLGDFLIEFCPACGWQRVSIRQWLTQIPSSPRPGWFPVHDDRNLWSWQNHDRNLVRCDCGQDEDHYRVGAAA